MSDVSLMEICRFYGPGPQGGDLGAPRPMHHCVTLPSDNLKSKTSHFLGTLRVNEILHMETVFDIVDNFLFDRNKYKKSTEYISHLNSAYAYVMLGF